MVFAEYAEYYDAFYARKAYGKECVFVRSLFRRYAQRKIITVLDLGCGTGSHVVQLAEKGYEVTGLDRSASMLKIAAQKLDEQDLKASLKQGDIQSFRLRKKIDAIVCLFSVIDYLLTDKDLTALFKRVSHSLNPGGVFVFDFWQASAAEHYYSPSRSQKYRYAGTEILRQSKTKINKAKNISIIDYVVNIKPKDQKNIIVKETHRLRYFDIEEMEEFCQQAGLEVVKIGPFMNIDGPLRKNTWDITMVARKPK